MTDVHGSLLGRPRDRLGPFVGIAAVGHVAAVLLVVLLERLLPAPEPPPPPFREHIEVFAAAALPKAVHLPDRATRAPAPKAPEPVTEAPPPTPEPVPPKSSDLAFQTEKPEPKPVGVDDAHRKLSDDAHKRKMEELLADLDAPEGDRDRNATSATGTVGASGTAAAPVGDPEYAAYVEKLRTMFEAEFRPLPVLVGKGYRTVIFVRADTDGRIVERRVDVSSGNPSYDGAALRATESFDRIPLPPAKFRDRMAAGYGIVFER